MFTFEYIGFKGGIYKNLFCFINGGSFWCVKSSQNINPHMKWMKGQNIRMLWGWMVQDRNEKETRNSQRWKYEVKLLDFVIKIEKEIQLGIDMRALFLDWKESKEKKAKRKKKIIFLLHHFV